MFNLIRLIRKTFFLKKKRKKINYLTQCWCNQWGTFVANSLTRNVKFTQKAKIVEIFEQRMKSSAERSTTNQWKTTLTNKQKISLCLKPIKRENMILTSLWDPEPVRALRSCWTRSVPVAFYFVLKSLIELNWIVIWIWWGFLLKKKRF